MKTVILAATIFIIIVLTIIFSAFYTISAIDDLSAALTQLDEEIAQENWTKCDMAYKSFYNIWVRKQKVLSILFDHNELEDIEISIDYLGSYITLREKNIAISELSVVKLGILHLKKTDKISKENLF